MISSPAIFAPTKYLNARETRRVSRYFLAYLCTYVCMCVCTCILLRFVNKSRTTTIAVQRSDDDDDAPAQQTTSTTTMTAAASVAVAKVVGAARSFFSFFNVALRRRTHSHSLALTHAVTHVQLLHCCVCVCVWVCCTSYCRSAFAGCVGVLRFWPFHFEFCINFAAGHIALNMQFAKGCDLFFLFVLFLL